MRISPRQQCRKQLPSTGLGDKVKKLQLKKFRSLEEGPCRAGLLGPLGWGAAGVLRWMGVRKQVPLCIQSLLLESTATAKIKKPGWSDVPRNRKATGYRKERISSISYLPLLWL